MKRPYRGLLLACLACREQGLTARETAGELGLAKSTVQSTLARHDKQVQTLKLLRIVANRIALAGTQISGRKLAEAQANIDAVAVTLATLESMYNGRPRGRPTTPGK